MVPRGRRPPPPPNANTHKSGGPHSLRPTGTYGNGNNKDLNTSTNKDLFEDTEQLSFFVFFFSKNKKRKNGELVKIINQVEIIILQKTDAQKRLTLLRSLSKKSIEKARCGARRRETNKERASERASVRERDGRLVWHALGVVFWVVVVVREGRRERREINDEKRGEVSRLQSPIKPFPPARKKEKEDKDEREEKDESNRQSVLSPTTSTSTTTTGGSAKHSEYNSSPERCKRVAYDNAEERRQGRRKSGQKVIDSEIHAHERKL